MQSTIETKPSLTYCDICNQDNSLIFDSQIEELLCSKCGAVVPADHSKYGIITESIINRQTYSGVTSTPYNQSKQNTPSKNVALVYADKGLSTVIGNVEKDAHHHFLTNDQKSLSKRLHRVNSMAIAGTKAGGGIGQYRNLTKASHWMNVIREKLNLTDVVMLQVSQYYRSLLKHKMTRGRSVREVVCACVYLVLRELELPRTMREVSESVNAEIIPCQKYYRKIVQVLDKSSSINKHVDLRESYITKYASTLKIKGKTIQRALEILNQLKSDPASTGANPALISISILYYAYIEQNYKGKTNSKYNGPNHDLIWKPRAKQARVTAHQKGKIGQREFAYCANTSEVTIRKHYLYLADFLSSKQ